MVSNSTTPLGSKAKDKTILWTGRLMIVAASNRVGVKGPGQKKKVLETKNQKHKATLGGGCRLEEEFSKDELHRKSQCHAIS